MSAGQERALSRLGFQRQGLGSHAARTMMLDELRTLLGHTSPASSDADYKEAVVRQNLLGKPTLKSRELTFRHLRALYGLDLANPLFRALLRLWASSPAAQAVIALATALARDPLLSSTQNFVLSQAVGASVPREAFERMLTMAYPDRFSPASLKSFAQNVRGSWTSAGYLAGHRTKIRANPEATPEALSFLLFLGYLTGRTGQRLFTSEWVSLLCASTEQVDALANAASHRGLLVFMNAGGVKEVRFPGYLSAEEERIRQEVLHVI